MTALRVMCTLIVALQLANCATGPESTLSPMTLAAHHYSSMVTEAKCSQPAPRVIMLRDIYPGARKKYLPRCTVLHVCSESTGCCPQETETCAPKTQHLVTLYFFAIELTDKGVQRKTIEKLSFANDTQCHCVPMNRVDDEDYAPVLIKGLTLIANLACFVQSERLEKLAELIARRSDNNSLATVGSEAWTCCFSPDSRTFAWSSGNRRVSLVSVQQLVGANKSSSDPKCETSIDCGFIVRSVTFVAIRNVDKLSAFWPRSAHCKTFFLVTGHTNGRIRVWDVQSGNLLLQLLDHKDAVTSLHSSPNGSGRLATTSLDGTCKVWDLVDEGNLMKTLVVNGGKAVHCARWSSDGKSLATAGADNHVCLWDAESLAVRHHLVGHQHNAVACDFSPDSCLLATASWDTRVIIWDTRSGRMLKELFHLRPPPSLIYACGENGNWIRSVSFAVDGAHVATISDDETVRIWDISADMPKAVDTVEQGLCCIFSPNGQFVAVGKRNGSAVIYRANLGVKPLLYLSRAAVHKNCFKKPLVLSHQDIPHTLLDYVNYSDLE
ncbi:WD repeat and SOCS box-containing protein 1 [Halotydeus destructor]|nr:WD repeat and SOCS box-containing protein 1 [Halotydeus destructor]